MDVREVEETSVGSDIPWIVHPEWSERFPWLCQGTTTRGSGDPFDMKLFEPSAPPEVLARWDRLSAATGFARIVYGRQVHGSDVSLHAAGPPGRWLAGTCDGHVTSVAGTLLTVTTADCVPVSVVDARRRAVGLMHAGWRGTAAGVLERGVHELVSRLGSRTADLHVHLGPGICGRCYEVGPEVHGALGQPEPAAPTPLDLRLVLASRTMALGIARDHVTLSTLCTLCGEGLFSHRGGDRGRQVTLLGVQPEFP